MSLQLCIQPVYPQPGQRVNLEEGKFRVTVQVTMSCGMPTCAGGRWDPRRFRVSAELFCQGHMPSRLKLVFTGRASEFSGDAALERTGDYSMLVEATDPETGSAGRLNLSFKVCNSSSNGVPG